MTRPLPETVMVGCSWDSGPYLTFYESQEERPKIDRPGGYGDNTVPISAEIWKRYQVAESELQDAESALTEAKDAFLSEARKQDIRWQEHEASLIPSPSTRTPGSSRG